jgi:hypothetical protein
VLDVVVNMMDLIGILMSVLRGGLVLWKTSRR